MLDQETQAMYNPRYLQYINLPQIPKDILSSVCLDFDAYQAKSGWDNYVWTDTFNTEVNDWCKKNICQDMYWGFQIITGDIKKHKDQGTRTKFVYLLQTGGDQVYTRFWDDSGETLLDEYLIESNRWHVLKVDSVHSVEGVAKGSVRFSITGKIF
jgi:hypothetical protein